MRAQFAGSAEVLQITEFDSNDRALGSVWRWSANTADARWMGVQFFFAGQKEGFPLTLEISSCFMP